MKRFLCAAAILILSFASAATAAGQDAAQFYKTHTLTLGSPNSAGGGYDIYVRALARHLGRYIPGNPNIVVQNVPAAGGMAFANQLYNTLPKDGSYIGMVRGTAIQEEVYKSPQVQFHGSQFAWLGNMNSDHDACIVSAGSGVHTIADLYSHQVVAGASGVGAQSYSFPVVYRDLLHMKFKVISGYPGTPERMIALERDEITGACGISLSLFQSQFSRLVKEGKIRLIAQGALHADPRYPDVPNILDQAKTPDSPPGTRVSLSAACARPFARRAARNAEGPARGAPRGDSENDARPGFSRGRQEARYRHCANERRGDTSGGRPVVCDTGSRGVPNREGAVAALAQGGPPAAAVDGSRGVV